MPELSFLKGQYIQKYEKYLIYSHSYLLKKHIKNTGKQTFPVPIDFHCISNRMEVNGNQHGLIPNVLQSILFYVSDEKLSHMSLERLE